MASLPPTIQIPAVERRNVGASLPAWLARSSSHVVQVDCPMNWATRSIASSPLAASEPAWSFLLREAAFRLRGLTAGWDGVGSQPVENHALFMAESMVREALEGRLLATAPYLVPSGDGSVQIEWHERAGEIELSIDPEGHLHIWGRDHRSGQQFEGEGDEARSLFARWAPWLAETRDGVDVPAQEEEVHANAA